MKSIYRHEVKSYFTGTAAYIFGAFLLLFAGIYTMAINLHSSLANFEYVLDFISILFVVLVPLMTMHIVSEERRQKTDQLLYSLPISTTDVILGKFLSQEGSPLVMLTSTVTS